MKYEKPLLYDLSGREILRGTGIDPTCTCTSGYFYQGASCKNGNHNVGLCKNGNHARGWQNCRNGNQNTGS